jgi:fumarate reductase subunit C
VSRPGGVRSSAFSERAAANSKYQPYHPKWYRKRYPIFWWLGRFAYGKFIARELTSLGVGYAAVLLMLQVWVLSRGPEAHELFRELLASPPVMLLHGLVLCALLFHSITWLNLAPRALVLRLGGVRIPDAALLAGHYAAWLGATALVVWYVAAS